MQMKSKLQICYMSYQPSHVLVKVLSAQTRIHACMLLCTLLRLVTAIEVAF